MSKYWLTTAVWAWEEALKWLAISVLGLILLGLDLGLGLAFLQRPVSGTDIISWVFGGLCLGLGTWMSSDKMVMVILWAGGLFLLASGFFSPVG